MPRRTADSAARDDRLIVRSYIVASTNDCVAVPNDGWDVRQPSVFGDHDGKRILCTYLWGPLETSFDIRRSIVVLDEDRGSHSALALSEEVARQRLLLRT